MSNCGALPAISEASFAENLFIFVDGLVGVSISIIKYLVKYEKKTLGSPGFPINKISDVILDYIGTYMPEYMFLTIRDTIEDIVGKTRGGLLTFGAVFALYMATNGMLTLMNAFNAVYMTVEKRGFIKTRLAATLLTIMLAGALILAVILLIVGSAVMEYFNEIAWLKTYLFLWV